MKKKLSDDMCVLIDQIKGQEDLKKQLYAVANELDERIQGIYHERTEKASKTIAGIIDLQSELKVIGNEDLEIRIDVKKRKWARELVASKLWKGSYGQALEVFGLRVIAP